MNVILMCSILVMCVYINDYDSTSKEGPFYNTFFCTSIFRKSLHGFVHDSGMLRRMILVAKWSLLKFFHNNNRYKYIW